MYLQIFKFKRFNFMFQQVIVINILIPLLQIKQSLNITGLDDIKF